MVKAFQLGGPIGGGMAHGLFVSHMHERLGLSFTTELPIHKAIALAVSEVVEDLVGHGQIERALQVVNLAAQLYWNASDWQSLRNAQRNRGGS
jgi:hypothetical protein